MGGGAGNRGPQVWRPAQLRAGGGLAAGGAPKIGHAPVAPVKHVPNYPAPTSAAPRVQAPTPPFRATTFQTFRTAARGVKDFGTAKIATEFNQGPYIDKRLDEEGGGSYTQRMRGGVCDALSLQWMAKCCKGEDFWGYINTQEGVDNTFKMQASMSLKEAGRFLDEKASELSTAKDHFIKYMDKARRGPEVSANKKEYLYNVADWLRTQGPKLAEASAERKGAAAALREGYLKKSGLSRGEGNQPAEFDSVVEACKQLQGFTGYAYIGAHGVDADGKQHGHAIAVYFSDKLVLVMDSNHGELAASGRQVGLTGLEGHLHEFFKPGMLGEIDRIEVDLFPSAQRPDRVENFAARVNGRGREAETEGASNLNNNNNAQSIVNNNNAPSVVNSNHDVPATEGSSGDPE